MPTSTISSRGQVTIPKEIRDQLGLKPGDRVNFVKDRTGRISLKAFHKDFRSLKGSVKSPFNRPITIEEMNEASGRGYAGLR